MKVSVVVPVYNPGPHLEPLIEALAAQSLPQEDFEAVFVDDGCTDSTPARLDALAAERPNMRVIHQANSGWAGGPRNVGTDAARGDYVLYVDSDDWIGSEALARMHAFATEHDLDVLVPRSVGHGRGVPKELFLKTRTRATLGNAPLMDALTAHKMYRRAFLQQEGLRFPEGRRRLEDHVLVLEAYFRARTIGVLSDYPYYHHVGRKDAGNLTAERIDPVSYYASVAEVLDVIEAHTEPGSSLRDRCLARPWRQEMLGRLTGHALLTAPEAYRRTLFQQIRALAVARVPEWVDARLAPEQRVLAALVRADRYDEVLAAARERRDRRLRARVHRATWRDGLLEIEVRAVVLQDGRKAARLYEQVGQALLLPGPLQEGPALSPEVRDVTASVATSTLRLSLRQYQGQDEWHLPVRAEMVRHREEQGTWLEHVGTVVLDPATLAGGAALPCGRWDLHASVREAGWSGRARVGTANVRTLARTAPGIVAGKVVGVLVSPRSGFSMTVESSLSRTARQHLLLSGLRADLVAGEVRLHLQAAAALDATSAPTVILTGPNGGQHEIPLVPAANGVSGLEGSLRRDALPDGRWAVHLRLAAGLPAAALGRELVLGSGARPRVRWTADGLRQRSIAPWSDQLRQHGRRRAYAAKSAGRRLRRGLRRRLRRGLRRQLRRRLPAPVSAPVLRSIRAAPSVPQLARRTLQRLPAPLSSAARKVVRVTAKTKVSVVIPTYNTDPQGFQRLLDSLAAQSMPVRDIEIVLIDDGSTDDTLERLQTFARTRQNVVVRSIPNSGWASRPRNVGIKAARGEYLLFMDHDDVLFPGALEHAYEFGRQHSADVVNAKEVRTKGWSWGWDAFTQDIPSAEGRVPHPLIPMTPHKLYRRKFVLKNRITFPEGRRVLWEDVYFNVQAVAHGARVSVLSRYPCYHWVSTADNTSSTFEHDVEEFWSKLAGLFAFIRAELAALPAGPQLIAHHLQARVLGFVGPRSLSRTPAEYDVAYGHVQQLVAEHAPPELDAALSAVDRCRIELVRTGRADLQRALAEHDRGVTALPVLEEVVWVGPELVLTVTTTLVDADGAPVRFRREGDRWVREVPAELAGALSPTARDITAELECAMFQVSVKGRTSRSTWPLAGQGRVSCTDDGSGSGVITAAVTTRFDPVAFAAEHDLDDAVWDFAARLSVVGYGSHRGLRGGRTMVGLLAGVAAVGYENRGGLYSLDMAAAVRTVVGSAAPSAQDVRLEAEPRQDGLRVRAILPLPDVHCFGDTRLDGEVYVGTQIRAPGTLSTQEGRAEIGFEVTAPEGDHDLRARFCGRTGATGLVLSVSGQTAAVSSRPSSAPD